MFSNNHKKVEHKKALQIQHWQKLLNNCNIKNLSSRSIIAPEMGATYPLDFKNIKLKDMNKYKGSYGKKINDCSSWNSVFNKMPSYIRKQYKVIDWMRESIIYTRKFYKENKTFLNSWKKEINKNYNSWQILEWRGENKYDLSKHILQFRASGIRVLRANKMPSLIAMTSTQRPIIGSEMRYISKFESAKLQNLHSLNYIPSNDTSAFKCFGNAVNAKIVELLVQEIKTVVHGQRLKNG